METYGACASKKRQNGAVVGVDNPIYQLAVPEIVRSLPAPPNENDDGSGVYVSMRAPVMPQTVSNICPEDQDDAYQELIPVIEHSTSLVDKDRDVFVATRSYQTAKQRLQEHRMVIIRGTPMSGKTAMGLALLRHFASGGYSPLVLRTRSEWRSRVRRNCRQCVLLDCVFGEVRVESVKYAEWSPFFSELPIIVRDSPNCLVVVTLHSHLLAQLISLTCPQSSFHEVPVVDVDDVPLTPEEKKEMLTKHLAVKEVRLDPRTVDQIVSHDHSGSLFPLCCGNYIRDFSRDQYVNLRYNHEVFTTPGVICYSYFCRALQAPDNWRDLVPLLLLAVNSRGHVLADEEQTEMTLRMLGMVTIDIDMEELQAWAAFLKGSILSSDMKQFRNRHLSDSFSFAVFSNNSMELFLNACDAEFLVRHVHVEPTFKKTDIIIDNTSPFFPSLLQRICKEILHGNIVQMSQHPAFRNKQFLERFEAYLEERRCLTAVMSVKDHRHCMPLLYWSAWSSHGALTCWCLGKSSFSKDDDRVVRQTFLACCLFGEKVNSPRMSRMFQWMCQNKEILQDAISPVSLPVPAPQDRLCGEVKTRSEEALSGHLLLTCGLPKNTVYGQTGRGQTDALECSLQRMDHVFNPGAPQADVAEFSHHRSSASSHAAVSSMDSVSVSSPRQSAPSFAVSASSSSGTYISLPPGPGLARQANKRQASLAAIDKDCTEGAESPSQRGHTDVCTEEGGDDAEEGGAEREGRACSLTRVLSSKSRTLASLTAGHLQAGIPVPPTIVTTSVEEEEGKVILKPICARWYAFLRLVSLCEVDEVNCQCYTLLHTAAFQGEISVVEFLVENGADLASLTLQGNTALTKAIERNQVAVVSYLLREGSKALLVSNTTPATSTNCSRDLSWMLGPQSLRNIFSHMVRRRRGEMLSLLLSYDIRLGDEEMNSLLAEAALVDDNHGVISLLRENTAPSSGGEDSEEGIYSEPEVTGPQGSTEERQRLGTEGKQKPFKGLRHFLGL